MLPGGTIDGAGDDDRVGGDEKFAYLEDRTTLTTLMSIRQEPIASAVYLQKIGAVDMEDIFRDRVASERSALPIKEYSGGGESKKGSSEEKCWV